MNVDPRGVTRGHCTLCSCFAYKLSSDGKCDNCNHPPGRHANMAMTGAQPAPTDDGDKTPIISMPRRDLSPVFDRRQQQVPPRPRPRRPPRRVAWDDAPPPAAPQLQLETCQFQNCQDLPFFDPNTGEHSPYCKLHMHVPPPPPTTDQALATQFGHAMDGVMDGAMSKYQGFVVRDGLTYQPPLPPNPGYHPAHQLQPPNFYHMAPAFLGPQPIPQMIPQPGSYT